MMDPEQQAKQANQTAAPVGEQTQIDHLFEHSADAVVILADNRFVGANDAAVRLFGYFRQEDFLALHPAQISPEFQPDGSLSTEKADRMLEIAIREGVNRFEWDHQRADGQVFPVEVMLTPYPYGDGMRVYAVIRDIRDRRAAEAALQAEKDFNDAILNSLPGSFFLLDAQGQIVRWNDNYRTLTGWSEAEIRRRNPLEALAPEDRAQAAETIAQVMRAGQGALEARILNGQGEAIPFLFNGVRLDVAGRSYLMGVGTDIRERKRLEDEQRLLAHVIESSPDVIGVATPDGRALYLNPAGLALLGYSPEDFAAGGLSIQVLEPDLPEEVFPTVIETGTWAGETLLTCKDGRKIPVSQVVTASKDAQGNLVSVATIARDIRERKQAEAEILAEKSMTEAILNSLPNAFYMFDTTGRLTRWNQKYQDMIGFSQTETAQRNALDAIAEEDRERVAGAIEKVFVEGENTVEASLVNRQGEKFPYLFTGKRMVVEDALYVLGMGVDISDRKQFEETVRASQQRLAALAANLPGVVFIIDRDGIFRLSEGRGLASLGLQPGQVVGLPVAEVYKDVPQIIADIRHCLETGQESVTQVQFGPYVFETRYAPLAEVDGKPGGVLGVSIDIADRLKAQQEIRESQQQLAALAANLPGSVFVLDKDGIFQLSEGRGLADLGLQPGQAVGQSVFDMYKDLPDVAAEVRRALAGDDDFVALAQVGPLYFETRYASLRDAQGNLNGALGVALNVTERVRLQQEAQAALERRGYQVEVGTQIAQEIASAPDLQTLFEQVVTLVKERFGYYHAQILRYDPARQAVSLAAGYGETGRKMLEAGHRLPAGVGLIGVAASSGQTTLRPDLQNDPEWQPNPLLPDTRGEIAVPIKLREQVLGVLDVQSAQADALGEDDRLLLEGLCGQIAVAIEDTRLRQEMEERLNELNRLSRSASRQGWRAYRQSTAPAVDYFFDQMGIQPGQDRWLKETQLAMDDNRLVRPSASQLEPSQPEASLPAVALPLALRGEVIGALALEDDPQRPLSEQDLNLVEAISEQVALALESARLFEQTQTALGETQVLYDIIAQMNAAESYGDILTALARPTVLQEAEPLLLMAVFDQPLGGAQRPEWIFPVAHRSKAGIGVADRYPLTAFEAIPGTLFTERPVAMPNLATDPRLDRVTRTLFQDVFQAQSSAVIPLMLGNQAIGFVQGYFEQATDFPETELSRLMAVAGQAAIAVQSRLLLEQAQSRARQEQRIREVTSQVFSASDVDTIMRRAVEQVGHVLGLPAYIYLGQPDEEAAQTGEERER